MAYIFGGGVPMYIDPIFKGAVMFASLLAMLSLGLTLTFLTTRVPNFAHGSFATIGIYVALTVYKVFNVNLYYGLPLAFMLGALTALALYTFALKPLIGRGASIITLMVATIAFDLVLLAILNIYADYVVNTFKVTSRYFYLREADFRLAGHQGLFYVAPSIVASLTILLYLVLTRTRFGIAMRATIENPDLASAVGINADLVYKVSWLLAGGLAGLAGGLFPLWFIGNPDTGEVVLVSIFAASIVGGLYNIYGGLIGGYLIGLAEVLGTSSLASAFGSWIIPYRPTIPLVVMVITLLVAPRGITGLSLQGLKLRRLKHAHS